MDQTRLCKHVIATRIATALDDGSVSEGFLVSGEMTKIYCNMGHCSTRCPVLPDAGTSATRGHNCTNDTDVSADLNPGETSAESLAPDPDN